MDARFRSDSFTVNKEWNNISPLYIVHLPSEIITKTSWIHNVGRISVCLLDLHDVTTFLQSLFMNQFIPSHHGSYEVRTSAGNAGA